MTSILKYLLIASVTVSAVYSLPQVKGDNQKLQGIIDALINNTLNSIIDGLDDPITVSDINLNMTDDNLNGYLDISSLVLEGITGLVATSINTNIFTLSTNITLNIPEIQLNINYDTDLLLLNLVPLYGAGLVSAKLDNINVDIEGHVDISDGISFSNTTIVLGLDSGVFELTGLLHNAEFSEIVTDALNDNLVPFINTYQTQISNIISPIAESFINSILNANKTEIKELIREYENIQTKLN